MSKSMKGHGVRPYITIDVCLFEVTWGRFRVVSSLDMPCWFWGNIKILDIEKARVS